MKMYNIIKIKILIFYLIILIPAFSYSKSFYKIVIDPGHSYKDAEEGAKIGPVFDLDGTYDTEIYAYKKGDKENTQYEFGHTAPDNTWDPVLVNNKNVGFIEAALNLEVAKNLSRMLKNAKRGGKKICDVYLTRENQGYVCYSP